MEKRAQKEQSTAEFARLESQVEKLLKVCEQLKTENNLLRGRQVALVAERARLIEKNDVARVRVEAMITRLKSLEVET
ncbi:MAG: TIGR02449 family protein [Gammaproteobacteria bacterium]|nr:TIGR02449 family protein [Gammaproteobacteria bacterium]